MYSHGSRQRIAGRLPLFFLPIIIVRIAKAYDSSCNFNEIADQFN